MLKTQRRTKSDAKTADKGGERDGRKRCTVEEKERESGAGRRRRGTRAKTRDWKL